MIGGMDIIISAPASSPVSDIVVRRMRQLWPAGIFQDADSVDKHDIFEAWVNITGTKSRDFFVYRDANAVRAWEEVGASPENQNTMLHFLIRLGERNGSAIEELTVVCDRRSHDVARLIDDLEATFRNPQMLSLVA